ncbi:MAG: dihydrolipoyl dehydrogenase [Intestinibacter sp.]|uniref:dihydrolipoyl dehydrogenase n=1 Tax=Intestinibacter sp. TaxID=1965304 RepID=UPI002A817F52|nr:dihydrolipoyl dehydrogenase [Intestinibacter sp.]MDY4576354.1 dihydrolipoyl dehydrogenase [Intestinibacter sp.]
MYDVVVVGGGPAGYVAAIKAAMLGGNVAIVESDKFGGTCLNRGCIPTKIYTENVEMLEAIKEFSKRGISVNIEGQDIKKAIKYKNRVTKKLVAGVEGLLKSYGVKIFKAKATVKNANEIVLENGEVLSTASVIIATGSKVSKTDIKGVLTSTEALELEEVPETMAIVGSDFIAIEFAEIFNSRGSKVTVISSTDEILTDIDREVSTALKRILAKKGIEILTNEEADTFVEADDKVIVKIADKEIKFDKVLLALGREANLNVLENLNVKIENGFVSVNDKMETSIKGIYAVGDVTGIDMTAHAAFAMGEVAAQNAMGRKAKFKGQASPKCLYTVPQVASVGLTEEEARKYYNIKVSKFSFAANGKALTESATDGFVKVITDEKYGEILGVHIIGKKATELVNEAAILKSLEVPADEAADIIFAHPTISEVLKEALADINNNSIHTPKK